MGKTGRWLKNFLTGKKERDKDKVKDQEPVPSPNKTESGSVPGPSPKEKKRWSFRRPKELNSGDINSNILNNNNEISEDDIEKTKHVVAVAVAVGNTVAADKFEAEAEVEAAAKITGVTHGRKKSVHVEDEAAVKIQANYRAYLARKALCALRGLVKLQALIRGHLVRMQATETLRRMQALVAAQERARTQRIQMVEEIQSFSYRTPNHRRSPQHPRFQQSYEVENYAEENIKIVEMDIAEPRSKTKGRNSYSTPQSEGLGHRLSLYYYGSRTPSKSDLHQNYSPCPSALTDISPIGHSGRFEEFSFKTAQSSPQPYSAVSNGSIDYPFFPNYMSNTESSRAKARSQSAPRQRHEAYERQSSRRRHSIEGRNIPRGVKMQRSSSQVGLPIIGHQFPWHLKLDRSSVSVRDSECGSNSSVLNNNYYCRSLAAYELYGNKY